MTRLRLLIVLACVCLLMPSLATTQTATSTIRGNVADSDGAALVNVTVIATHIATNNEYRAVTDADGNYVILGAPPGEYTLSFELAGFRKAERAGIRVEASPRARVDVDVDLDRDEEMGLERRSGEAAELLAAQAEANRRDDSRLSRGAIVDSHIHLWDLPRSGPPKANAAGDLQATTLQDGSLFPEDCCGSIAPFWNYDFLMSHYNQTPGGRKVSKVVLVEALPGIGAGGFDLNKQVEGNQWMLDQAKHDTKILSVVGLLNVTLSPAEFNSAFDKLRVDKRFVGIRLRGFYVANADGTFKHFAPNFITNMRRMVRAGLSVFDIPEEETHPTATVALAREFPRINFVVNHYANYNPGPGANHRKPNDFTVPKAWLDDLALLAAERNIYVKVGFILKWGNPTTANFPWPIKVSDNLAAYRPGLEAMLNAFGADRLMWESNWPTSEMSGGTRTAASPGDGKAGWREGAVDTIDLSLRIVESWLATKEPSVRDKIMGENALRIYSPRR